MSNSIKYFKKIQILVIKLSPLQKGRILRISKILYLCLYYKNHKMSDWEYLNFVSLCLRVEIIPFQSGIKIENFNPTSEEIAEINEVSERSEIKYTNAKT